MKVLAVLRAPCFSPNSEEKDLAIMTAVVRRLREEGHSVEVIGEEHCPGTERITPDVILSMGRYPETLRWQKATGVRVINSPDGVARCRRSVLQRLMKEACVPMPPETGSDGYWLKRGDCAAQTKDDVVFAADEKELQNRIDDFRQRGIDSYTVSAHVVGDVVKFYGVRGTGFFRCYYPTDDGVTKFGDEQHNGRAMHYPFEVEELQQAAERLAAVAGVEVYGGDCIVRQDGTFCIIDFNDWPSFSRCREEAAEAIVSLLMSYEF